MMDSMNNFLDIIYIQEDLKLINEIELSKMISKFTPVKLTSMAKSVKSSMDEKNPGNSLKRMKSAVNALPDIKMSSIDKAFSSKSKEYNTLKKTAKTIIKNSLPNASDRSLDAASSALSVMSMVSKKGEKVTQKENLKRNIKTFVLKTRKFMDDHDVDEESKNPRFKKEDVPDLAVAWVIVAISTALAIGLGSGLYLVIAEFATLFPYLLILGAVVGILYIFLKMAIAAAGE